MGNAFKSVALSVLVGLSLLPDVFAAGSDELVVVEQIGERRFRLVNNSTESLVYMHWLNKEKNPVPYCRYPDDSISICSRDPPVVNNGKAALEEASLKPGKSITFDVAKGKAIAVGVRLLIEGEQRLLWHEL
jgi:hypothetical protein